MQNNFGDFLKQKRIENNLTQKELAKILIVSESAVSKWEKNVAHPDISLLPKLSEILGVTEHELITASIDKTTREDKLAAKKWRAFSFTWSLFFYISYIVALIPCFICDLAINGRFTWFYIVVAALLLAFTFTNLPKLIKKHKLILLPTLQFIALLILLAVCCNYTSGNWFIIAALSILLGLTIIFLPIFVCRYKVFAKIKKYGDFFCILVDFLLLALLLMVIDNWCLVNNYTTESWFVLIALPVILSVYFVINLCLSVRLLKINKLLKTSIVLLISTLCLIVPPFIKVDNPYAQQELNDINIFYADLTTWNLKTIEPNVWLITFLSLLGLTIIFAAIGLILHKKKA